MVVVVVVVEVWNGHQLKQMSGVLRRFWEISAAEAFEELPLVPLVPFVMKK